jgi:hypothetical protein
LAIAKIRKIMKFNSAICTTREQSERLLALGLKKETADCCYYYYDGEYLIAFAEDAKYPSDIPAWSLHRLIEIVAHTQYPYYVISKELPIYDALCERIEWLIKEGYFNKEYLV